MDSRWREQILKEDTNWKVWKRQIELFLGNDVLHMIGNNVPQVTAETLDEEKKTILKADEIAKMILNVQFG